MRSRESLPFGANIKKAAFKATFGDKAVPALQKYATFRDQKAVRKGSDLLDDLDELTDDSVSCSDSEDLDSVSLNSIEVGQPGQPSNKKSGDADRTLKKVKSKKKIADKAATGGA